MQRFATQIEETIAQAHIFRIIRLTEYRQGQITGFRQHFHLSDVDFHLARVEIGVFRVIIARHHFAFGANHAFGTHRFCQCKMWAGRLNNQLRQTEMVAQINK